MRQLIINADDFGYSVGVNTGIICAHKNGVLTSATLMANMPGTTHALQLANEHPSLGVGIHLVLTASKPLNKASRSLVDKSGNFYHLKDYATMRSTYSEEEIFNEWCTQIDYLLEHGLQPTHFDSHHHVHFFPENIAITQRIAEKYHLPFRNAYGVETLPPLTCNSINDLLLDMMNTPMIRDMSRPYHQLKAGCLAEIKQTLLKGHNSQVIEMMVHPAFVDTYLYENSSFSLQRIREVEILCDPVIKQFILESEFELVNYSTANNIRRMN